MQLHQRSPDSLIAAPRSTVTDLVCVVFMHEHSRKDATLKILLAAPLGSSNVRCTQANMRHIRNASLSQGYWRQQDTLPMQRVPASAHERKTPCGGCAMSCTCTPEQEMRADSLAAATITSSSFTLSACLISDLTADSRQNESPPFMEHASHLGAHRAEDRLSSCWRLRECNTGTRDLTGEAPRQHHALRPSARRYRVRLRAFTSRLRAWRMGSVYPLGWRAPSNTRSHAALNATLEPGSADMGR